MSFEISRCVHLLQGEACSLSDDTSICITRRYVDCDGVITTIYAAHHWSYTRPRGTKTIVTTFGLLFTVAKSRKVDGIASPFSGLSIFLYDKLVYKLLDSQYSTAG